MEIKKVESSLISGHGHDPDKNVLRVVYPNGSHYEYENVTPEQYAALDSAPSQGKWLLANIRGNKAHPFRQVIPPTPKAK